MKNETCNVQCIDVEERKLFCQGGTWTNTNLNSCFRMCLLVMIFTVWRRKQNYAKSFYFLKRCSISIVENEKVTLVWTIYRAWIQETKVAQSRSFFLLVGSHSLFDNGALSRPRTVDWLDSRHRSGRRFQRGSSLYRHFFLKNFLFSTLFGRHRWCPVNYGTNVTTTGQQDVT